MIHSIKKLIDEFALLKKAMAKKDQRQIERVTLRIDELLNYLYIGLGGKASD